MRIQKYKIRERNMSIPLSNYYLEGSSYAKWHFPCAPYPMRQYVAYTDILILVTNQGKTACFPNIWMTQSSLFAYELFTGCIYHYYYWYIWYFNNTLVKNKNYIFYTFCTEVGCPISETCKCTSIQLHQIFWYMNGFVIMNKNHHASN